MSSGVLPAQPAKVLVEPEEHLAGLLCEGNYVHLADVVSELDTAHFLAVPLSFNFGGCTFPDRISNSLHFLCLQWEGKKRGGLRGLLHVFVIVLNSRQCSLFLPDISIFFVTNTGCSFERGFGI